MIHSGLAAIVAAEPHFVLLGEVATGEAAVERFRALRPDVTRMDLSMPGLGGIDAIRIVADEQARLAARARAKS